VDLENNYISQNRAEGLPPGAPSASEGWSAMVQLLDKEMPSTKKGKRYLLPLILFPLFFTLPLTNRNAGKQKVFLAPAERPLIKMTTGSTAGFLPDNETAVVHARETIKNQITTLEEIKEAKTRVIPDTSMNQSQLQQMRGRDQDNSGIVKTHDKKDSSDKKETLADDATELEVQTGLSWSLPMPMGGTQNYFAGPSGTTQPYRYALPGAWISLRADNYLFTVSVNPFASSMVQPAVIDSSVTVPDSVTRIVKSNAVTKLFGIVAALHIDHRIGGNWWAGGGLQGNWWQEAVSTVYEKTEKISSPSTGPGSMSYQTSSAKVPDSAWTNLSRFQIFLNGELIYRTTNWQAGVEAGFSVTPLANSGNPKNLFNAAVFFRLPIITKQIKVKEDQ
jgi:hypothetical protein